MLDIITFLFDFLKHVPDYLQVWADQYGSGLYIILILIIFCETGLVVTPFLPGDSLLFATGALLSLNLTGLDIYTMCLVLTAAAIVGDLCNYSFGRWMSTRLFKSTQARWLNKKHLEKTQAFYQRHGGKAIILARYMPIVRTYAPFVAGLSGVEFKRYIVFNIIGAVTWVNIFLALGYFFGTLPWVKSNFQYIILAIIIVSFAPIGFELAKGYFQRPATRR